MIIKEQVLKEIPLIYDINIYVDNNLSESSDYIIRKQHLKVPDTIKNSQLKRTSNKNYQSSLMQFNRNMYKQTKPAIMDIVDKSKIKISKYLANTESYGSTSTYIDNEGYMCYAFYVEFHIKPELFIGTVDNSFIPKLDVFKIRFSEHINPNEYKSLTNNNTIILNTIYSIDENKDTIYKCVNNVIEPHIRLYDFIANTDDTIFSFADINNDIIKDCLDVKIQGNFNI